MAKAKAECTCKVCGRKFYKISYQNSRKSADNWEEWATGYQDECQDCIHKEREEKAATLAKEAKENGLPELQGSSKQITWAEQLRSTYIEKTVAYAEGLRNKIRVRAEEGKESPKTTDKLLTFEAIKEYILNNITNSKWWIDSRNAFFEEMDFVYEKHRTEIDEIKNRGI